MVFLAQLLPYELDSKKNGGLRSALREYQSLIKASLQAMIAIRDEDYEKFDSLVGENACEIRAVWLCCLAAKKGEFFKSLEQSLKAALEQLEELLEQNSINPLMRSELSLKNIIENNKLNIPVSHEGLFFIISFILSELKVVKSLDLQIPSIFRIENAAPKNFKKYGDVSTSFVLNLMSKFRKKLAASSVQFVKGRAFALQDPLLIKLVSDEFLHIHNALSCIPMFWTYKAVLSTAQTEGIPLIIHAKFLQKSEEDYVLIDEEKLFYKTDNAGCYQQVAPTSDALEMPACIVQGIACIEGSTWSKADWKSRMSQRSVIDVILAGAADHRQYPDPALDSLFVDVEDSDYAAYKELALREGFSSENPTTFFIQHVYAALGARVIDEEVFVPNELDRDNTGRLVCVN